MNPHDRATLVWHRHVKYTVFGAQYRTLSDLGLELYNDATNILINADNTVLDNVHQVQSDISVPTEVVVKIFTNDTDFDGLATERYALAGIHQNSFLLPPKIWWDIFDGPVWVNPLDPVTVKFPIQNTGQLTAHDNRMVIDYGRTGIVPKDGNTGPRPLPSLRPGETIAYDLDLLADVPEGTYELLATLIINSYGERFSPDDLSIIVEVPRP